MYDSISVEEKLSSSLIVKVSQMSAKHGHGRFSPRVLLLAIFTVVLALGLALGVGLGVGLTGDRGGSSSTTSSASASVSTATPTSSTTSTGNGTVWQPAVNSTWQIVLEDPIVVSSTNTTTTPDVENWDIDLFTNANSTIETLHSLKKKVICYFSAGTYEPYRPDSSEFPSSDLGKALDGWPDEKWLNISSPAIRKIMAARILLASQKGCDALDPDNVDGYDNENGLGLTQDDSIDYVRFLAKTASGYGLAIGLKNAGEILPNLTSVVQFSINEQCVEYSECDTFSPMIQAGKPVFHIEYPAGAPGKVSDATVAKKCSTTGDGAGSNNFSTILKDMDLDGWIEFCDGTTAETGMDTD